MKKFLIPIIIIASCVGAMGIYTACDYLIKPTVKELEEITPSSLEQSFIFNEENKPTPSCHASTIVNFKDKCTVIPLSYRNDNVVVHHYEDGAIEKIRNEYTKPIAIFTGRHVEYKGLEYAIKAFKSINDMTFLVAGVGPLSKNLRKMAESNQNIHFIGMLSHKLYRLYLNSAHF